MENKIQKLLYKSIEQLNEDLDEYQQLASSPSTELLGSIDSITLVSLIVTVEQNIKNGLGVDIALADERALSQKVPPFRTIGTLNDYILRAIND